MKDVKNLLILFLVAALMWTGVVFIVKGIFNAYTPEAVTITLQFKDGSEEVAYTGTKSNRLSYSIDGSYLRIYTKNGSQTIVYPVDCIKNMNIYEEYK